MLFISTAIMFGVLLHSVFLFSSYYYFTFVIIACAYMGMGHFLHTFNPPQSHALTRMLCVCLWLTASICARTTPKQQ